MTALRALCREMADRPGPSRDEGIVLGALVSGALKPADVAGWEPAPGFGQLHRRAFFAILESLHVLGRVDLRRVLAYVGTGAGTVWRDGRCHGYLPDLARRAPRRGGAVLALGRLAWAAEADAARRAREADAALEEVHRMANAAAAERRRTMPGMLRAILEAGGDRAYREALGAVPADERPTIEAAVRELCGMEAA